MNSPRLWFAVAIASFWLLFAAGATPVQATLPAQPAQDDSLYLPMITLPPEPAAAKLGADFGNLILADGVLEQDFPLAKQMGAQWQRVEVPWLHVEATRGVYTWEKYDAVVARALEVVGERAVYDALADQRADGGDRAQLEWEQGLPVPHLAKEDVVVEAGELGGEIASWSMRSALMRKGIPKPHRSNPGASAGIATITTIPTTRKTTPRTVVIA